MSGIFVDRSELDALNADRARLNYILEKFTIADRAWYASFFFEINRAGLRAAVDIAIAKDKERLGDVLLRGKCAQCGAEHAVYAPCEHKQLEACEAELRG